MVYSILSLMGIWNTTYTVFGVPKQAKDISKRYKKVLMIKYFVVPMEKLDLDSEGKYLPIVFDYWYLLNTKLAFTASI